MESELDYFRAGSQVLTELDGEFIYLPGFDGLPAGCVLHNVDGINASRQFDDWVSRVEEKFRTLNASLHRIYVTANSKLVESGLEERGYQVVREVGLVGRVGTPELFLRDGESELYEISSYEQHSHRKNLYQLAARGADGHDMSNGRFAELEQIKQEAGYMTSFLFHHHGLPVATVSLAVKNEFARLKNLLVHPNYRGKGLGKRIVKSLMLEASNRGATYLGAYAEQGKRGHRTYLASGLQPVTSQIEFSKDIGK